MTFPLPPLDKPKVAETQQQPHVEKKTTKDIDKVVEQSARDKIPPKSDVTGGGWRIWSWLGFGTKEKTPVQQEEAVDEHSSSFTSEERSMDEESLTSEPGLLEETAVKAYQAAGKTTWQSIKGSVLSAALRIGAPVIRKYAGTYDKFDKEAIVASQKQEMLAQLNDPQFVEFYEAINTALIPTIKKQVLDVLGQEKDSISQTVAAQETLILKLLEVVLARGFANLARTVKEHASEIPNFGKQTSLVSVLSLFSHKAGQHIDQKKLEGIEKKYQKDQVDLIKHIETLFPGIEDQPDAKVSLRLYIKEYVRTTDKSRKETIKKDLFPSGFDGPKAKEIQAFFTTLDHLHMKSQETHHLFSQVSEEILLCLFPNRLADFKEIEGWGSWGLQKLGVVNFDLFKNIVTDLLQDSYEPLENDLIRNEAWEKDLTTCLGVPDLKSVVQAPSALLIAFTKSYIQSDPSVVETASGVIDDVLWQGKIFSATKAIKAHLKQMQAELKGPNSQHDKSLIAALEAEIDKLGQKGQGISGLKEQKEAIKQLRTFEVRSHLHKLHQEIDQLINLQKDRLEQQKHILDTLSQQQLANWIVGTVQSMLNTEDPNLAGLGQFVKQVLNNLTLALIANGAKLVIPKGEKIELNAFMKEFSERLIKKASALTGDEAISEKFWRGFVDELPLPTLVKNLLIPIVVDKVKSLQATVKKSAPDFQEIQRVYAEALQVIHSYEGGAQLLTITETVSDQIIEQVLEQNLDLVSTLGLGDTVEELFAQYLPGITFNEELKNWFKENISALGVTETGKSPQSIVLLKQGIQAVMLKAMVNTIEKNFHSSSKDYAAQLLKNFHAAFSKAFTGFTDVHRKQLDVGLRIQADINEKKEQLKQIKEKIADKPTGITPAQMNLLEEVIVAKTRTVQASSYVDNLKEKRDELLAALNRRQKKKVWTAADLTTVNEALILRKMELPLFSSAEGYLNNLKSKIKQLGKKLQESSLSPLETAELKTRRHLLILVEMSPDALKQLSEAASIQATLQHAESEFDHLDKGVKAKEAAIVQYEKGKIHNQDAWSTAKSWMDYVLQSKQQSYQIYRDIAVLEKKLDAHLYPFKVLSKELTALLGLDKKDNLDLPPFLQDKVWPLIESAQEKQIARLLFSQIAPLLISVTDVKKNKDRLRELSSGNPFLGQLIQAASEDIISRIPDYVTSYKPFAHDTLVAAGISQPTEKEIVRMEASLSHVMIELGKNGTTASMLKPLIEGLVPQAREEELSQSIAALIPQWDDKKASQQEILALLKKEVSAKTTKEQQNLEKQAELLAKSINQFLFNRGKQTLEPKHILQAYHDQIEGRQTQLDAAQTEVFEANLQHNKIIKKIKSVVITPEEISVALNSVIPGAADLHFLIAPQLQAVIVGEDQAFKASREVLQQFLEGTVLRLFVKIAEANQSLTEDPMSVITGKLKDLAEKSVPEKDQTPEEAARKMIDQVLTEVLDIRSQKDFDNIPASLQKLAYDKLKEQAYQRLNPLILPIIERNQSRAALKATSGSDFLGSLCQALSKDVFAFLPKTVNFEEIATYVGDFVPHVKGDLQIVLAKELQKLTQADSTAYLNTSSFIGAYIEGALLKVFVRVAEKNPAVPPKDSMVVLTEKLLDLTAKKYQEVKEGKNFEAAAQELNDAIMKEMLGIDSPAIFKGLPENLQIRAYDAIKDQLGGLFVRIQKGLSTIDSSAHQVQETKEAVKKFGIAPNATKAYAQILSEDIANMLAVSVPHVLAELSGENMRGVVIISKGVEKYLEDLARGNVQIAQVLLNYAQGGQFKKMLGDNLGKLADKDLLVDDKQKAADLLGNLLLEPMGKAIEKAINFEEQHKKQFNQKLMANLLHVAADHFKHLNAAKALAAKQGRTDIRHADFVQAVGSKLHPAVPTAPVTYQETIDAITDKIYGSLNDDQKEVWLQEQENVRKLIADMIKKEGEGKKVIELDDFVKDFELIHLKIVSRPLTDSEKNALKSADKDGLTLRNVMRKEAQAPSVQREKFGYAPTIQAILSMLFPNGQKDLTFVPEELKGTVWKLLKEDLSPVIFSILTETLLEPTTIKQMVLSSLENMRDNLSGKIVVTPPEPVGLPLDELDQVSGELIAEVLNMVTLPEWAKKLMIDPKTGEISDSMKKTLGGVLRSQFNDTFIKDKLEIALKTAVKRDEKGNPMLSFDTRPKEIKAAEAIQKAEQMEKDLKKTSREVIHVSISYFIRNKWAQAQARFDKAVEGLFGNAGAAVKRGLDRAFGFIFFKVIGTLLYYPLILPLKIGVQKLVYRIVSLDENLKNLEAFIKVPTDQPEADLKQHAVYHEDLIFKISEALSNTVEEFLDHEPVVPMANEQAV